MNKVKIKVENLTKSFGSKKILRGINFEVKEGESLVILGGSGSGKSVCIKIITKLMEMSSGTVTIDGANLSKMNEKETSKLMSKIGFLFQGGALFDSLKIWENVAFRLMNYEKINRKHAKEIAIEKLKLVGLSKDVADLYPSELSGGMQKRAALARAIAISPEIIFFDEPTTGLDPIMADVINDLIIKNSKELGATTVTITHDMHSARRIADKVAMLYEGEIIWFGDIKDIDKSKNEFVDQFINGRSTGPINFLNSPTN